MSSAKVAAERAEIDAAAAGPKEALTAFSCKLATLGLCDTPS